MDKHYGLQIQFAGHSFYMDNYHDIEIVRWPEEYSNKAM